MGEVFVVTVANAQRVRLRTAVANGLAGAQAHTSKAHKAFVLYPCWDTIFVKFNGVGGADIFAMTAGNAGVSYFKIISVETLFDINAMIKLCCTLSSTFSRLSFRYWSSFLLFVCAHRYIPKIKLLVQLRYFLS